MRRLSTLQIAIGSAVAILSITGIAVSQVALPAHPSSAVTTRGLLSQPFDDSLPNAAQIRRGQYLVAAGDCLSCHLRAGGAPWFRLAATAELEQGPCGPAARARRRHAPGAASGLGGG